MRETGLPPGLTQEAWDKMKQQQRQQNQRPAAATVEQPRPQLRSNVLSTGLTVDESSVWTTVSSKANKKKKKKAAENGAGDEVGEVTQQLNGVSVSDETSKPKVRSSLVFYTTAHIYTLP